MKAEEEYNSLFEKEGSIEAPASTKGVGGICFFCLRDISLFTFIPQRGTTDYCYPPPRPVVIIIS